MGKPCEICEVKEGDRWVTIVKESGGEASLWVCPEHALFLIGYERD